MVKERTNSIMVTFYDNVGKGQISDYFGSLGHDVSNVHEIPRLLLKRYTADVPESKVASFVETFKANDIVLSAYPIKTEYRKPSRFEKLKN